MNQNVSKAISTNITLLRINRVTTKNGIVETIITFLCNGRKWLPRVQTA